MTEREILVNIFNRVGATILYTDGNYMEVSCSPYAGNICLEFDNAGNVSKMY